MLAALGGLAGLYGACANSAEDCALIGTKCDTASSSSAGGGAGGTGGSQEGAGGAAGGGVGGSAGVGGGAMKSFVGCDQKQFGDGADQAALSLGVDIQGQAIAAGSFAGKIPFGGTTLTAQTQDLFLLALNPALTPGWAKSFPVTYQHSVSNPATGDLVVIGHYMGSPDFGCGALNFSQDFFIVRFDRDGNCKASHSYAVGPTARARVAVDGAGDIAVAGTFEGPATSLGGPNLPWTGGRDVFVARFDPTLKTIYSRALGDVGDDDPGDVLFDPLGNVAITASFQGKIDLGTGDPALALDGGDILLLGLAKADGATAWSRTIAGNGEVHVLSAAMDAKGGLLLAGRLAGEIDFGGGPRSAADGLFLADFDPNGKHLWSNAMEGAGTKTIESLAVDVSAPQVAIAGTLTGTLDLGGGGMQSQGADAYVGIFDAASGAHVWSKVFGDAGAQSAGGVAFAKGSLLLAGGFAGTLDVQKSATSNGGADIFVARLCPGP